MIYYYRALTWTIPDIYSWLRTLKHVILCNKSDLKNFNKWHSFHELMEFMLYLTNQKSITTHGTCDHSERGAIRRLTLQIRPWRNELM